MLICQNCSAENEDHYRFCLACGSELAKQEAARIVERPSRPGGREEAKRPQINDLKNRLQALRVSRDANGVSEHDSVDLDRDAPLPGWTKPPDSSCLRNYSMNGCTNVPCNCWLDRRQNPYPPTDSAASSWSKSTNQAGSPSVVSNVTASRG